MNVVKVFLNCDEESPLRGVPFDRIVKVNGNDEIVSFVRVPNGTYSGSSAVSIIAPLPDGKFVCLEITMNNFEMVAAAFKGAEERGKRH